MAGYLLILSLVFLLNLSCAAETDPSFQYNCLSNEIFIASSAYGANLRLLLTQLSSVEDFNYGFSSISIGGSPNKVNAIGLCRGDQMEGACRICLNQTISELQRRCSDYKKAVGWSDFCMVRYSSNEIFGVVETYPSDVLYSGNASDFDGFNHVLSSLLNDLTSRAASGGPFRKFAAGSTESFPRIYALEQCTPDLSLLDCSFCLATAIERIETSCYGRTGCRVVQPSCNVRYEINPFFAAVDVIPQQSLPHPVQGNDNISAYSVAGILLFVIAISLCIFLIPRKRSTVKAPSELHTVPQQFDLQVIRRATDNFSAKNKLGEGHFATVFKGTLLDGRAIAVKRLEPSKQSDSEFKNEVNSAAQLQHRNLVRLYGFCSEGNERLLILEFVPGGSLDHFLFDQSKRMQLDWKKRREIIRGVASGLLYLHKHSHFRMVHCDLKTSNILLDKNMNPKIADFGGAKLLKGDESQGSSAEPYTGTPGYTAPEYAVNWDGRISVKADVYSFGVLILVIVSGREATDHCSDGKSIHSTAWENWTNKTISGFIDPTLREGPTNEIFRCIHIGLLCIQEDKVRPKIDSVVKNLNYDRSTTTLPEPEPPAVLVKQEGHYPPPSYFLKQIASSSEKPNQASIRKVDK
ncbi:hypothetical protein SLEP1_g28220 [Rubroshorea leprosula]|uniref:Uncharacterized protein n=1 Tax=Rubroshorea leprosula TaxID=152421 RepID=A0AAV5JZ17_9ROSI|nr:hypothetical protein SLEP1_g28220 [Rubroshorea leprosula]